MWMWAGSAIGETQPVKGVSMRTLVTYLLGLTLVAIAAFGAYHAYSMSNTQAACASGGAAGSGRHAPLRA